MNTVIRAIRTRTSRLGEFRGKKRQNSFFYEELYKIAYVFGEVRQETNKMIMKRLSFKANKWAFLAVFADLK